MTAMMLKRLLVAVLLPLALLAGCGGGSGGGDTGGGSSGLTSPATTSSATSVGAISGFGSVIVNGIHWSDDASVDITLDDVKGTKDDLRVGMVGEVEGTMNDDGTGKANKIRFQNLVRGPVASVNTAAGSLVVLGQTVKVSGATVFDDVADLASIAPGDVVAVSGWFENLDPTLTNDIVARRIERKNLPFNGELKVRGFVKGLDGTGRTFRINNLVVDFSNAQFSDTSAAALNDGFFVDVRTDVMPAPLGGTLIAETIKLADMKPAPAEGARVEVEGIITDFDPVAKTFKVGGIPVDASAIDVSGLANGMKVEVEGIFVNGVLVLRADEEVEIELEADIKIEALVQSTDVPGNTITVLGKLVRITPTTQFKDDATDLRTFGLADIQPNDAVRIRAFEDASGNIVAVKVIRRTELQKVVLQGRMDTKDPGTTSLTILGVMVQGGPNTQWELADVRVDAATWFAGTAINTIVKAAGSVSPGNVIDVTAGEVETEEDHD